MNFTKPRTVIKIFKVKSRVEVGSTSQPVLGMRLKVMDLSNSVVVGGS